MDALGQSIESAMFSRSAVGVLMLAILIAIGARNRSWLGEVWHDPSTFWRIVSRLAAVVSIAAMLWTTVLDDWLQLVAEPLRRSMKWEYQRIVYDPIASEIRTVTIVLLGAMLVTSALLVARHVGGYGLQLAILVLSGVTWVPLYVMGQRMNSMLVQGAESSDSLLETLGLFAFWVVRASLGISAITVTLLFAMMPIALVATALLDLIGMRQQPVTDEADSFFRSFENRTDPRDDLPLSHFWKPIRRPS